MGLEFPMKDVTENDLALVEHLDAAVVLTSTVETGEATVSASRPSSPGHHEFLAARWHCRRLRSEGLNVMVPWRGHMSSC